MYAPRKHVCLTVLEEGATRMTDGVSLAPCMHTYGVACMGGGGHQPSTSPPCCRRELPCCMHARVVISGVLRWRTVGKLQRLNDFPAGTVRTRNLSGKPDRPVQCGPYVMHSRHQQPSRIITACMLQFHSATEPVAPPRVCQSGPFIAALTKTTALYLQSCQVLRMHTAGEYDQRVVMGPCGAANP